MKLQKLKTETEYEWHMRQVDENLHQADRNLKQVVWMWKWLLIPMWSFIIIMWVVRAMR